MGLGASVMCNCIKEGLEIPSEFKEYFFIDEDGEPDLSLPYEGNEELHNKFFNWMGNACPHHRMVYIFESISNWPGIRIFQSFLEKLPDKNCQVICDQIPDGNGGVTSVENAKKMLTGLDTVENISGQGSKYVLLNANTKEEMWEYIPQYNGVFSMSADNIDMGVDLNGFFIQIREGKELFRSKKFTQKLLNPDSYMKGLEPEVCFKDFKSKNTYICRSPLTGDQIKWPDGRWENDNGQRLYEFPEKFITKSCKRQKGEFDYIIKNLRTICKVSIETGNPIRWC